jgi:hypothetical protein
MLVTTRKYLSREGLSEISDIAASPVAPGRFSISVVDYERILELLELTANKMGSFSTPPKHLVEAVSKDSPSGIYNFKGTTRYEYQRTKHGARWRETF